MKGTEIVTDETMRELREHGSQAFPFKYYYDEFREFAAHSIEWHWHSEFEWIFVESGVVECLVGSARIVLGRGEAMFINSRVLHRFESQDNAALPNILFKPEFLASNTSAIYEEYVFPVLNADYTHCVFQGTNEGEIAILEKLKEIFTYASADPPHRMAVQIAVLTLWHTFVTWMGEQIRGCKTNQNMLLQSRIRIMLQFIAKRYQDKITLDDIALAANISKSEALRCFHFIQSTPVRYLVDYRLNRAKELLLTTDDTITQIAVEVGIDNISYFVRVFTKAFHVTPKEFRRQYKRERAGSMNPSAAANGGSDAHNR